MKEKGSAIISALFVMILVSIAATAMSLRLQIDIQRTTLIKNTQAMLLSAQNATLQTMSFLLKKEIDPQHTTTVKPTTVTSGAVKLNIQLTCLQGLFNLNNLKDKKYIHTFAQLLLIANPKMNVGDAIEISEATADWVKRLNIHKGQTSLDSYYLEHGYQQPHMPMASTSEFRLIKGVNQKIYRHTQPFITALPPLTAINVNTAPRQVLQILGAGLSKEVASKLIQERGENGFKSEKAFNESKIAKKMQLSIDHKHLSLDSEYYLIAIKATLGNDALTLFSRIKLTQRKNKLIAEVLAQSINTR